MPITITELDEQGLEARTDGLSVWGWFFRDWRVLVLNENIMVPAGWDEELPDFDEVAPGANALVDLLQTIALSPLAPPGVKEALTQTVDDAAFSRLIERAKKKRDQEHGAS